LSYHTVEAKASTVLGELDRDDNILLTSFKGRIVNLPVTLRKPFLSILIEVMAALSIFVACGISALAFLKNPDVRETIIDRFNLAEVEINPF